MKIILGISAFYHDSAAALLVDDEVIAAAQEERFTRKKHTSDFPVNAIKFCLDFSGYSINNLDAVVFYDKPLLKFERLLETYYEFAPKGLFSFLKAIPSWATGKIFLKNIIKKELSKIGTFDIKQLKLLFSEHHISHASSAYYSSSFKEAAILTIDGVGEWATTTISYANGKEIKLLKEMRFPHSVGLLYSSFTYFLGFKVNSGEYKLMGLAPYGDPEAEETCKFISLIKENLVNIKEDGSIWLNQKYFNYTTGLTMVNKRRWESLFGFSMLNPGDKFEQIHCNLAYACQKVIEEIILKMAIEAKTLTGSNNLCMAGGVALNCVANGMLIKEEIFSEVYIQPAAGDAGGAIGAAQAAYHLYFNQPLFISKDKDIMKGSYLGPEYTDMEVVRYFNSVNAIYRRIDDFDEICSVVADLIDEGMVVGWFQGRMEFGPRALGNRSILGDARNPEMQKKINLKIKCRESFRPFAPAILYEDLDKYYELHIQSPYMLINTSLLEGRRICVPENYNSLSLLEKLYFRRSDIPTVTHVDFSARIQTVTKETNPRFWKLLRAFKDKTGYGIMVNTSFNVRGEPIVCSPLDAYNCFMRTEMDWLVLNNFLLRKIDQPEWRKMDKWVISFSND